MSSRMRVSRCDQGPAVALDQVAVEVLRRRAGRALRHADHQRRHQHAGRTPRPARGSCRPARTARSARRRPSAPRCAGVLNARLLSATAFGTTARGTTSKTSDLARRVVEGVEHAADDGEGEEVPDLQPAHRDDEGQHDGVDQQQRLRRRDDEVAAETVRRQPGERRHERLRQVADAADRRRRGRSEPVRSYDSQPIVVSWIHIAADWKALPIQTRRKSRYLNAYSVPILSVTTSSVM